MIAGDPDTVGERVQVAEGRGHRGLLLLDVGQLRPRDARARGRDSVEDLPAGRRSGCRREGLRARGCDRRARRRDRRQRPAGPDRRRSTSSRVRSSISRAVAEAAYARGAKFVEVCVLRPARQALAAASTPRARRSLRARRGSVSVCSRSASAGGARITFQGARSSRTCSTTSTRSCSASTCCRDAGDRRDVGKQQMQLVHRAVPDPGLGGARASRSGAGEAAYERLWEQIERICGSTSPTRWRRGRRG